MNNESVFMTRRYPGLRRKQLVKDSKIAKKLIKAWDTDKNQRKVLSIFSKEKDQLTSSRYWELLRTVWIICGNLSNVKEFKQWFNSNKPNKHYFSTPEEAEFLNNLPDKITVYRAGKAADHGISWTLSRKYAYWYKKRYEKAGVRKKVVDKSSVFAYINRNKEEEILILN